MSKVTKFFDGLMIIPAIAAFYLFDSKVLSIRSTSGKSMEPTINGNSVLIVDKLFFKLFNKAPDSFAFSWSKSNFVLR